MKPCCNQLCYNNRILFYRLFYAEFSRHYGDIGGQSGVESLKTKLAEYNDSTGGMRTTVEMTPDGQTIIALCTPLMRRVHATWQFSQEQVFVDSSGNMDRQDCRVFLFLTHSPGGALPLGVVITSSESESTLTAAFTLLKGLIGAEAFFSRADGPQVFLTDDCAALRNALHSVWSKAHVLLCFFHLLQALWRWLWDTRHQIGKDDRPHLLRLFKAMMYAEDEEELTDRCAAITTDPISVRYPQFVAHINSILSRRAEWSLVDRLNLSIRGNNTTAYCEAGMRVLKDKIFHRLRAYNIVQLADFMLTRYEDYHMCRLTDVANNRLPSYSVTYRLYPNHNGISLDDVTSAGNDQYTVLSSGGVQIYDVDMQLHTCTCPVGKTGAPCKHQAAVVKKFGVASLNFLPVHSITQRKKFHYIATGNNSLNDRWFQPLHDGLLDDNRRDNDDDDDDNRGDNDDDNRGDNDDDNRGDNDDDNRGDNDDDNRGDNDDDNRGDNDDDNDDDNRGDNDGSDLETMDIDHNADNHDNSTDHCGDIDHTDGTSRNDVHSDLKEDLVHIANDLSRHLDENPNEYVVAIQSFIKSYKSITTDSHRLSALHTFSKFQSSSTAHTSLKRGVSCLQTSTQIGVQPTSVARRRLSLGGRRRLTVGRPPKTTFTEQHTINTKHQHSSVTHLPSKKRSAAPHNLQHCVTQNISLGKKH